MDTNISPAAEERSATVRLEYPRRDSESLAQAAEQAAAVRDELADLEDHQTFDEFLRRRRGRLWLEQQNSQV